MRGLVISLVCSSVSWAFIPPIENLLEQVFSGRRSHEAVELTFRHLVQAREGESFEVIERFIGTRANAIVSWQTAASPPVYADWNGKDYSFRSGKTIPSRTNAFIDYFLSEKGDVYRDRLLREKFLRREQLAQFKGNYNIQGDPKTWATRDHYIRHPDISRKLVGRDFAYAVIGMQEGDQKRAFYLSSDLRGLQRLEWQVGSEQAQWDFLGTSAFDGMGRLPKVGVFSLNGKERIRTTVASARGVRKDAVFTARTAARQPSAAGAPTAALEEAIRLIVRYR